MVYHLQPFTGRLTKFHLRTGLKSFGQQRRQILDVCYLGQVSSRDKAVHVGVHHLKDLTEVGRLAPSYLVSGGDVQDPVLRVTEYLVMK